MYNREEEDASVLRAMPEMNCDSDTCSLGTESYPNWRQPEDVGISTEAQPSAKDDLLLAGISAGVYLVLALL